ncbi:MAG: hypothetical protein ACK52I_32055 [Pseudomonadota bacterium]
MSEPVSTAPDAPPSALRRMNAVAAEGTVSTFAALVALVVLTALGPLPAFGIAASVGMIAMLAGMSVPWPRPPVRPGLARLGGRLAGAGHLAFVLVAVVGSGAFGTVEDWLAWLAPAAALGGLGLVALHLAAVR